MKATSILRGELRALDQMVRHIRGHHLADKTVAEVVAFYRLVRRAASSDVRRQTEPVDFQPEDGEFVGRETDDHYRLISQALLGEHSHRKCQMLFLPSFAPEGAVYVVRFPEDASGLVVVKEFELDSRPALLDAQSLDTPYTRVQRWEARLEGKDADLLETLWVTMLSRVHYEEEPTGGFDGVEYHAAHFARGFGYRSGKTWSPHSGTLASDFIAVAEELQEFAKEKEVEREVVRRRLMAKAGALLERTRSTRS